MVSCLGILLAASVAIGERAFPDAHWKTRVPAEVGLTSAPLNQIVALLGGHGCIIKDGYVEKQWVDQATSNDWLSSVLALFFVIEAGKVKGVDQPIADYGWELLPRHQGITFRHLGAMNSGYARPGGPGEVGVLSIHVVYDKSEAAGCVLRPRPHFLFASSQRSARSPLVD